MKSQDILAAIMLDCMSPLGVYSGKDVSTLHRRVAHEGDSFLTMSLPTLDDALLQGLSRGLLPPIPGFASRSRSDGRPKFLWGLWSLVFDRDCALRPDLSESAVSALRQISRFAKKRKELCSQDRIDAAIQAYRDTDRGIKPPSLFSTSRLSTIAHYLFGEIVGAAITNSDTYQNGPGAVADRLGTVARNGFPVVGPRVADEVGIETFRATWQDLEQRPPAIHEIPARLSAVAKTALTPRLISMEPSYNMYVQQGLKNSLYSGLARYPWINLNDQSRNRRLAREGSIDSRLATIDLSEASDRIGWRLVQEVFRFNPTFVRFLANTRSQFVDTGREILLLSKFASMGSALTFPVQSMLFASIVVLAYCDHEGNYSRSFVRSIARGSRVVGVYGDDIICDVAIVPTLVSLLTEYGLKVNSKKSYWTGPFRESCGGDYVNGVNVTPIYMRAQVPERAHQVARYESLVKLRNQLYHKLYPYTATVDLIDNYIRTTFPEFYFGHECACNSSVLALCGVEPTTRWNSKLQRREYRGMTAVYGRKPDGDSTSRLFKALGEPFNRDPDHLTLDGRPTSATLKRRWGV